MMFKRALLIWLLLVWLILVSAVIQAGDDKHTLAMTKAQVIVLLADAVRLSGLAYETTRAIPIVVSIPKAGFDKLMCGAEAKKCAVRAVYIDEYNMIVLSNNTLDELNTVKGKAILVHELVHYLAQMPLENYRTVDGCVEEENRAYAAQRAYLKEHNGDASSVMRPSETYIICASRFGGR